MSHQRSSSLDAATFQSYLKAYLALVPHRGRRREESVLALASANLKTCEPEETPQRAFGYSERRCGAWIRPGSEGILKLYHPVLERQAFPAMRAAWRLERVQAVLTPSDPHSGWKDRGVLRAKDLSAEDAERLARVGVVLPKKGLRYCGPIAVLKEKGTLWIQLLPDSAIGEAWVEDWILAPDVDGWSLDAHAHEGVYDKKENRLLFHDKWFFSRSSMDGRDLHAFFLGRLSPHAIGVEVTMEALPSQDIMPLPQRRAEITVRPGIVLPLASPTAALRERINDGWRLTEVFRAEDTVSLEVNRRGPSPTKRHLLSAVIAVPNDERFHREDSFSITARLYFETGLGLEGTWHFPLPRLPEPRVMPRRKRRKKRVARKRGRRR